MNPFNIGDWAPLLARATDDLDRPGQGRPQRIHDGSRINNGIRRAHDPRNLRAQRSGPAKTGTALASKFLAAPRKHWCSKGWLRRTSNPARVRRAALDFPIPDFRARRHLLHQPARAIRLLSRFGQIFALRLRRRRSPAAPRLREAKDCNAREHARSCEARSSWNGHHRRT